MPAGFPSERWPLSRRNGGRIRPEYATRGETLSVSYWVDTSSTNYWCACGIRLFNEAGYIIGHIGVPAVSNAGWAYKTGTISIPLSLVITNPVSPFDQITVYPVKAQAWCQIANDDAGTPGYARFSDMKISRQGSISADQVNAVEINADNITTGTLSADRIDVDNINAGSVNGYRTIIGSVAANGTIKSGTGFTVNRTSVGDYSIIPSTPFSGSGQNSTIIATPELKNVFSNGFGYYNAGHVYFSRDNSDTVTYVDTDFCFILVGPR